jgi:hypothetical protein
MNKIYICSFLLLIVFEFSCRKCPTTDELQGTWKEEGGNNSKLTFNGDLFFVSYSGVVDSSHYTLDRKHFVIWTTPLNSTSGGKSYQLDYHKRKGILTVMGLFPVAFGEVSKSYYKKQ